MSILDDAIREHLELKRAHGADDHELKKLEDEAFGPPQRPDQIDPFAEAPTEFLVAPTETPADLPAIEDDAERSGRRPNLTDLQEAPAAEAPFDVDAPAPPADELAPTPDAPPPSPTDAAEVPLPPPPGEAAADLAPPTAEAPAPPAEAPAAESPSTEEHPAGEHEIVTDLGPSTEERHAIADQPTQMFDVQAQMDAEVPVPTEQESPSDQELVDAAQGEPQAAPPAPEEPAAAVAPPTDADEQPPLEIRGPDAELAGHPPAEAAPEEESAEYDFFNEQRLSDELDQALEAPITEERDLPSYGDAPAGQGAIFDFESHGSYEEDPSEEALRRADAAEEQPSEEAPRPAPEPPSEEFEPPSEEAPRGFVEPPSEEVEPPSEEVEQPAEEAPRPAVEPPSEEAPYFDPDTGHEDVLEDRPQFLESEDDDDLWFEQKPPKDFDLD
jgi:hypothetical protein